MVCSTGTQMSKVVEMSKVVGMSKVVKTTDVAKLSNVVEGSKVVEVPTGRLIERHGNKHRSTIVVGQSRAGSHEESETEKYQGRAVRLGEEVEEVVEEV